MKEIKSAEAIYNITVNRYIKESTPFDSKSLAIEVAIAYASQFIDKAAEVADTTLLNETQVVEEIYKLKSELK